MTTCKLTTSALVATLLTLTSSACGGKQVEMEQASTAPPARPTADRPPERTPSPPPAPDAGAGERARAAALSTLSERVHFDYDRSEIKPEFARVLERKARVLRQYPSLRITVEGHCDERGSVEYNLALGQRRSEAAKQYLISLGVPAGQIRTTSFGKDRPLMTGSNESAWSQNRRSEFVVENPDAIAELDSAVGEATVAE